METRSFRLVKMRNSILKFFLIFNIIYIFLFLNLFLYNYFILTIYSVDSFFKHYVFSLNEYGFLIFYFNFIKYCYFCTVENFISLYVFLYKFLKIILYNLVLFLLKFKILLKNVYIKFLIKKQIFMLKSVFKIKGFSEYFGALFFKPNLYRFYAFYIGFMWIYIGLDWIEHFIDSLDRTDGEFEMDFEYIFTWEEDPLIGRNFLFLGQRLASQRTSEQPDFYKINEFFYQSKYSKIKLYNREFLGGPVYLNLLDFFSLHEIFHQLGAYEFFGASFVVMFTSFESDLELDFLIIQKLKLFFRQLLSLKYLLWFENPTMIISIFLDLVLYFISIFFLMFKYIYKSFRSHE